MTSLLTFLFTDLENSTGLWQQAPIAMQDALARHDAITQAAVKNHNGRIVKTTGDGLHAVFESAADGVLAAVSMQQAMGREDWPAETGPLNIRVGCTPAKARRGRATTTVRPSTRPRASWTLDMVDRYYFQK